MNDGIRGLPGRFGSMPQGLLGNPRPFPMPHRYWHPEAIDWSIRCASNGGVVSEAVMRAVHEFCRAIDAAGIRSQISRLNLFVGGNLSGALVPLYRSTAFGGTVLGNATDTNVNFVSADFSETGSGAGLKGNGTTKYVNTGFLPSTLPSAASTHLSFSATGCATSGNAYLGSAYNNTATGILSVEEYTTFFAGRSFRSGATTGSVPVIASPATVESHLVGTRTSTTSSAIYTGGSLAASNTTTATPTLPAVSFFLFALNTTGTPSFYSACTMRVYSIGSGLTALQAAAFSAAVIAFNAALGR